MDRGLAAVVVAVAGGLIAFQAPINGRLGRTIGAFPAASVSFALGLLLLLAITAVTGKLAALPEARHVPWWYLLGGFLGAAYVTTVLVTVGTLGAGGVTAATIAGQLTLSLAVDRFGWLGVEPRAIGLSNAIGVVLLAAGVFLVVRD